MMLLRIASFEVRRRLRMLSTYVYFAIFFGLSFFWISVAGGAIKGAAVDFGAGGKVYVNAPFSIFLLVMLTGHLGTIVTAAMAGRAVVQDIEHRATSFFFTAPISKLDYLGGRFLGALLSMLLLYPAVALGAWAAAHSPLVDPTRVGPDVRFAYLAPYVTVLLPNLLLTSAIFFSLATLLRRMLPVYVGAVVLVLGYLIALDLTADIENRPLAALIDPFGGNALDRVTEYWTIAEKNARLVPLTGLLLYNRLIWTGIALALLVFTYVRFSFAGDPSAGRAKPEKGDAPPPPAAAPLRAPTLDYSAGAAFSALASLTRLQFKETVKNVFFLVIVLAGVLFVITTGLQVDQLYGTKTYPVTYEVLEIVGGTFTLFVIVIIAFYSGELVWRERDAGLAPIFDALPIPRWVVFTSKLLALMAVQVVLLAVLMATCILLQTAKGYHEYELGLYAKTLFGVRLVSFWILCCLAMLVHVVANHKYVGHFAMILYFVLGIAMPLVGLEHHIYRFGSLPEWTYSAMNGFGHFVQPMATFQVYWALLAIAFAVVSNALWVRGMETGLRKRLALAWATRSRGATFALAASLAGFAATAGFIYWNTNHVNAYRTRASREDDAAAYETKYARDWKDAPQPKITAMKIDADIFPEERRVALRGTYALENLGDQPIAKVMIEVSPDAKIASVALGLGEHASVSDERLGVYVYDLPAPLAPHAKTTLAFDLGYANPGFRDSGSDTRVVYNGTFFDSRYLPRVGYDAWRELTEDAVRHKHGFAPQVIAPAGDPVGSMRNYVAADSHWIDFDATVSTSADQLAIAPGYLEREWTENGRRYFHYAVGSKILGFVAFLSARYAVVKDHWSPPPGAMPGSTDVDIEIDYHPGHTYDLDRMVKGVKASLDYYTTKFGPYQHHQVRIVEFPRYERFAQSFPNTIPYSESIGFIARVDDAKPEDIDYPFYVTAHEVAHQWWADQVVGGNVQGATMLSESLAQYSALMVMKHAYGPDKMKRFLRYELDRYLHGRSTAKRNETPLVRVENEPYIHYAKGSLVFYALQDYAGEDAVDAALARFVAKWRFAGPPYPDAPELVADLREATPPEYRYLIEDMFETITLYENRATKASAKKLADGRWEVSIDVVAKKLRASEVGGETEVPVADFIDVGVLDADGKVLALERKKIEGGSASFTLVCAGEPAKAGIDPLNELIDRLPDDNVIAVAREP